MRTFAIAALVTLAYSASAQDTSVHVSYTTRAARAVRVLADLAQISKVDLKVSPQTANDVLVISVKDVALADVMSRIAVATSGEWKQEGSSFMLIGSTAQRRKEENLESERRVIAVRKSIADRAKLLEEKPEPAKKGATGGKGDLKAGSDVEVNPFGQMGGSPDEKVITRLLLLIDPTVLANTGPGDRIVFSTEPVTFTVICHPVFRDKCHLVW